MVALDRRALPVFVWSGATAGRNLSDGHLLRLRN